MVDHLQTVCCMCGDVGFSDKLFHCSKCRFRYQHSYCSNYYSEYAEPIGICDWCQCEERNSSSSSSRHVSHSSRNSNESSPSHARDVRSAYSGDKIKQNHRSSGGSTAERATVKTPSPRHGGPRRYKLLKDVMC